MDAEHTSPVITGLDPVIPRGTLLGDEITVAQAR